MFFYKNAYSNCWGWGGGEGIKPPLKRQQRAKIMGFFVFFFRHQSTPLSAIRPLPARFAHFFLICQHYLWLISSCKCRCEFGVLSRGFQFPMFLFFRQLQLRFSIGIRKLGVIPKNTHPPDRREEHTRRRSTEKAKWKDIVRKIFLHSSRREKNKNVIGFSTKSNNNFIFFLFSFFLFFVRPVSVGFFQDGAPSQSVHGE